MTTANTMKDKIAAVTTIMHGTTPEAARAFFAMRVSTKGRDLKEGDIVKNIITGKIEHVLHIDRTSAGGALVLLGTKDDGNRFYLGNYDRIDVYAPELVA
ncbi:hypothetical protein MRQ47_004482 [Salmonella enterica]|nr:hypothetical protein [Salmonella enterica]